jgi:hypothetical protein
MKDEDKSITGGGKQIRSPEDLRVFAQEYYSKDFSNPEREGCPGRGTIKSLVRSETLPDDNVRQHLFSCSDCFMEYREAMAAYKGAPYLHPTSWWKTLLSDFKLNPTWALAAAAFFILITALGILSYKPNKDSLLLPSAQNIPEQKTLPSNANSSQPSGINTGENITATAKRLPSSPRPKPQSQPLSRRSQALIARVAITIDLREDVMRAAEEAQNSGEKIIELPAARTSLLFNLPEGSDKGLYEVRIVDPFGKTLKSSRAMSPDGKILRVLLDLRGLAKARYRLCVSRTNEAPDCHQVVIGNRTAQQ